MPEKKRSIRDQLKGRTQEQHSEKDSGGRGASVLNLTDLGEDLFFKPEIGENLIDIIPYVVKSNNHPKLKAGDIDYLLDVWVHKSIGVGEDSFVCLKKTYKKPCPICEEAAQLAQDGADEDILDSLKAKHRVFYNVIDLNAKKPKIQLFEQSHYKFEKELLEEAETGDGEIIVFSDPAQGSSISFRGRKASFKGRDFTEIKKISLEDREMQYEDDIVKDSFSLDELLKVPSYDAIKSAFFGNASDEKEDADEKPVHRKAKKEVEEDEEKEAPKKEKAVEKKSAKENKCPSGHKFGTDCDEHKECKKCDSWDACSDSFEENN